MRHPVGPSLLYATWLALLCAWSPSAIAQAPAQQPAEQPVEPPHTAPSNAATDAGKAGAEAIPLEEIRRYVSVFNTVKQGYVEPVEDRKLMQSAIRGLLLDLDPHSAYLVRSDADSLQERTEGSYAGIGVEVQLQPDGTILVIAPIDGTPAARAGIRAGDLIIAIDGKLLSATPENENPLRGEPGSSVTLRVQREGRSEPLEIPVTREVVRVSSVQAKSLEPGYGYIRISTFQADTGNDFVAALDRLQAEAGAARGRGLRGLVIDLRSNPGGILGAAVRIADELLDSGTIVSTRARDPLNNTVNTAEKGDRMNGAPIAVLIDAGSASASEVLAAALGDNRRATLVGSRSFGKGSVQAVLPLDNGDAIKLTTARYYTPNGTSIQARGIRPDVVLKPDGSTLKGRPGQVSEAALAGHLEGEGVPSGSEGVTVREGAERGGVGDVLDGDAPIQAALKVLKQPPAAAGPGSAPTAAP